MAGNHLLAPYIQQAYNQKLIAIPSPDEEQIFGPAQTAPRLDSTRANRIIVYPGSFNPPHRGHLHLLNHVFYHGVPDLNVVAAIVLPSSDGSLLRKCYKNGTSLMFGREERCHMWKKDPNFPEWAWVFEAVKQNSVPHIFTTFTRDLQAATAADGYQVEFIFLYGPDRMTPLSGREPEHITLLCDAARVADYQRSSGRLKDFTNFSPWKRVNIDREQLTVLHRAKTQLSLATLESTRPDLAQEIIRECPDYIDKLTRARVAAATRDLHDVLHCQDRCSGTSTLRFIKYKGDGPTIGAKNSWTGEKGTVSTKTSRRRKEISSTKLRDAMCKTQGAKLQGKLEAMALAPEILWWYAPMWFGKARSGRREWVRFLSPAQTPAGMEENVGSNPRKRRASVAFAPEDGTAEGVKTHRRAASV